MSEPVELTIAMVQEQVQDLEQQVIEKKRMVNSLCGLIHRQPIYPDSDLSLSSRLRALRSDEYYGQPLASAIRMVLERRQAANLGPATVNDIYDALVGGGYKFETKNEDYAKRGLYQSLSKNSVTFHRLPNGAYGLLEWYPNVKPPKQAANGKPQEDQPAVHPDQEFKTDDDVKEDAEAEVAAATSAKKEKAK